MVSMEGTLAVQTEKKKGLSHTRPDAGGSQLGGYGGAALCPFHERLQDSLDLRVGLQGAGTHNSWVSCMRKDTQPELPNHPRHTLQRGYLECHQQT